MAPSVLIRGVCCEMNATNCPAPGVQLFFGHHTHPCVPAPTALFRKTLTQGFSDGSGAETMPQGPSSSRQRAVASRHALGPGQPRVTRAPNTTCCTRSLANTYTRSLVSCECDRGEQLGVDEQSAGSPPSTVPRRKGLHQTIPHPCSQSTTVRTSAVSPIKPPGSISRRKPNWPSPGNHGAGMRHRCSGTGKNCTPAIQVGIPPTDTKMVAYGPPKRVQTSMSRRRIQIYDGCGGC